MAYRPLPLGPTFAAWAVLSLGAAIYGAWRGLGGPEFALALGVFIVLLGAQMLLAAAGNAERLAAHAARPPLALAIALLPAALYLVYAAGTGTLALKPLLLAMAYALAPPLLLWTARHRPPGAWQDYVAVLALWLPFEFNLIRGLWTYGGRELGNGLTVVFALNVAVGAFLLLRRLDGVGYRFGWAPDWGRIIAVNFLILAAIAIPLGLAIGFIEFAPAGRRLAAAPLVALGVLLFTAWPEELLFRGLLQNLLGRTLRSRMAAWIAASAIFGLAHVNNLGFPNWRYVLLAAVAGLFYGRAWMQSGSIFPAAIVHALVNTVWVTLFRTP